MLIVRFMTALMNGLKAAIKINNHVEELKLSIFLCSIDIVRETHKRDTQERGLHHVQQSHTRYR